MFRPMAMAMATHIIAFALLTLDITYPSTSSSSPPCPQPVQHQGLVEVVLVYITIWIGVFGVVVCTPPTLTLVCGEVLQCEAKQTS